ncbi:hypothetical protein N7468_003502 [Penicillium chermesinum]|uniref:CCD97-like C-terminal domain-containing protein n=1 Tax=Penicillium chermesinum TaxID=63820 RepID=A0A9W9TSB6_9EURO|nr:uncharacterized protein N7468_003502 [Penicillium chermesinum]KAJ5238883.1 hypothetical protein N7468_003502 [Penicillium chermesinum]
MHNPQADSGFWDSKAPEDASPRVPPPTLQVKNRRIRYLAKHPEYFSEELELADPLLYDRLIRRFQTPEERKAKRPRTGGFASRFAGILEAELMRAEAKMEALAHPETTMFSYTRGPNGEVLPEDSEDIPATKEIGLEEWKWEMGFRFVQGNDREFDYKTVDENDEYDDWNEELDQRLEDVEEEWIVGDLRGEEARAMAKGETGIQDY